MEQIVSTLKGSSQSVYDESRRFIHSTRDASKDLLQQAKRAGEDFVGETRRASRYFVRSTLDAKTILARGFESEARNVRSALGKRIEEIAADKPALLTIGTVERRLLSSVNGIMSVALNRDDATERETPEEEAGELPIDDYDSLNAKTVVASLDELGIEGVQKIHDYELLNKRRVTVLRATNMRLSETES